MKIVVDDKKYGSFTGDAIFFPVFIDDADYLSKIDKFTGGTLRDELVSTGFSAEFGEVLWVQLSSKSKQQIKVCLLGLGEKAKFGAEVLRRWAGKSIALARERGAKNIAYELSQLSTADNIQAAAEGAWLSDYRFLKYKKTEAQKWQSKKISQVTIFVTSKQKFDESIKDAAIGVLGTTLARNLVNEPANYMRPRDLVDAAVKIADGSKIELGVLGKKELQENGFGAFLAVAQGSDEEPYLIHLFYSGGEKPEKRIALVGKGVTFDSGGISLKPSDKISDMKVDMAGAAAVLGIFRCLTLIDLPLEIHGIIPVCENLPSGRAILPGDVVTSFSGKTIEILNTDAEGRLVLADALSYVAKNYLPNIIIDFATLTGACKVALGENIAGVMTQSDKLMQSLQEASEKSGEKLWRLPLEGDYHDKMKSEIADIKNITDDKFAGAIMGGLFLQEFVPEEIEFAHIDIAGPACDENGKISYIAKGGTGFGIRTIVHWLKGLR